MKEIAAVSGGKDSTAMVVRLHEVEPNPDREYVITPTGDELPPMHEHWRLLGELLGKPLKVVTSGRSLQGLIRHKGVLPNWRMRWCTRILKLEPFNAYLKENAPAVSLVGLRADEEQRRGMIYGGVEGITQRYPLREWGWTIDDVWQYLEQRGITVPDRTDCARCFFQRLGEWYELWRQYPELYAEAEDDERRTGYTFRAPGGHKDTWPAPLAELRLEFERDRIPRGHGTASMFDTGKCRVCTM